MFTSLLFVFIVSSLISTTVEDGTFASLPLEKKVKYCVLPPYPEHGRYVVSHYPFATPGQNYPSFKLDVSCDFGYLNGNNTNSILCVNGSWSSTMPSCVPDTGFCILKDDVTIEYHCAWVLGSFQLSQECQSLVPSGTVVNPICKSPAYFSLRPLSEMHCRDGIWDYEPICKPACGLTTQHLKLEGSSQTHVELPWQAVIYEKILKFYLDSCSGALISANKIISAVRCFTDNNDKLSHASHFIVAVNKMYREYDNPRDKNSQVSQVIDIKIPSNYQGKAANYMDNIAIVVVERPFIFHLSVRPVCLDFDNNLDRTQLIEGNSGKAAYWSYDNNIAPMTLALIVDDLSCTKFEDCYDMLQNKDRLLLTNDKFCAGPTDDTRYIYYGFGTGLAFVESTSQRYYLRGVVSNSFPNKNNTYSYIITSIVKHEHFIKQYCNEC